MARYVTLAEAKKHLNIEPDFVDDDDYVMLCVDSAEEVVAQDVCISLSDIEDEQGKIPAPLQRAILLMAGTFYTSRETIVYGQLVHKIPAYDHIIGLYRNYAK
jgi:hypothetical protein